MPNTNPLQVAVGIAEAIDAARVSDTPLNVGHQTRFLSAHLSGSDLTPTVIADVLRSEGSDAGVQVSED